MKPYQTLEMDMAVHICHPNCKRREFILIQRGFADVLYSPPQLTPVADINKGRTRIARSIIAPAQVVSTNPVYLLPEISWLLDLLS